MRTPFFDIPESMARKSLAEPKGEVQSAPISGLWFERELRL